MLCRRSFASLAAVLLAASGVSAYTPGSVRNGGRIEGFVRADLRPDETLKISKDSIYCGDSVPAERFLISPKGGLRNAVVRIEEIDRGKPFASMGDFVILNVACRFVPHVMVVPAGATMKTRSLDRVLHTAHFYLLREGRDRGRHVSNLALPRQGMEIGKQRIIRNPGLLSVRCNAHNFMQGWVWVVENPYAAVTGEEGGFALSDVPPGTYDLEIWHEVLGGQTLEVRVESGRTAVVDVRF